MLTTYSPKIQMILSLRPLVFTAILSFFSHALSATVYNCSSVSEIRTAMAAAVAGDEIVIAAGTYADGSSAVSGSPGIFYAGANGTASQPIILRSASASNPAILSGTTTGSKYVLHIEGDYWEVRDLKFKTAEKGIILDHADHCSIINCEIYEIGHEAIHVRDATDYTLVEACNIHHTGRTKPQFGEGIYVGSDRGAWGTYTDFSDNKYDPYVDYTTVRNCSFGPEVRAEALDIKEGTSETVVEYCTFDATGLGGHQYSDAFIDLKGIRSYIRYNTFNRNGDSDLSRGIATVVRDVDKSSYEHAIHDNIFNMDYASSGPMVLLDNDSYDVYAWDNIRNPAGEDYDNGVITSCCPAWYNPGAPSCPLPSGLSASNIDTFSVSLNWNSVADADAYDLRYQVAGSGSWTNVNGLTSTSYALSGLADNTTYAWEVRSDCTDAQSSYVAGSNFTTLEVTNDGGGDTGGGETGTGTAVYDDALAANWNNYSFGGSYNLAYTGDVKVGAHAIQANYSSWGGLNLKHDTDIDGTGFTDIRFWIKGEGAYLIRLKVNSAQYEFTTTTDWQQITVPLSTFGSPSTIEAVVLQNRSSSSRTVYIDQIEFVGSDEGDTTGGDDDTGSGDTGGGDPDDPSDPGDGDDTGGGTPSNGFAVYDDALAADWNNYSFSGSYDLAYTADVAVGSQSIRADYSGWGGLNLKTNNDLDGTAYSAISFWIKGEGAYLIRLKVNGAQHEFTTTTAWQQITLDLSEFGNPSLIDAVVLQNRSSSSRTVFIDQIEFISNSSLQQTDFDGFQVAQSTAPLSLFPNPTTGDLQLQTNTPITGILKICDLSGQCLKQIQLEEVFEINLSLTDLPKGSYFIQIPTENGILFKRIIKQ